MRYSMILASVLATACSPCLAVPTFSGSQSTRPDLVAEQESDGWKWPKLWGTKEEKPKTQAEAIEEFINRNQKPTTTERIKTALTDNPLVRTTRGWMKSDDERELPRATVQAEAQPSTDPTGPPTPSLLVSMAQLRERQGDIEGARRTYQQALAANPRRVKTLREFGHFEDRQGQLASAERYYGQAADVAPDDPAPLNDLALCLARQGKLETAANVLDRAVRLAPNKPLYRNNMATVLMELGEQHAAMDHLMAAHGPATAFYNMGHLLEKGGQQQAAAAHYAEAVRIDPTMQAAQAAASRLRGSEPQRQVTQTAMRPATVPPATEPDQRGHSRYSRYEETPSAEPQWPSEPIRPAASTASERAKPGPRPLPPIE